MMSDALRLARLRDDDSDDDVLSPLCQSIVDGTHQTRKRDDRSERLDQIAAVTTSVAKVEAAAHRGTSRKKITKADMEFMAEALGDS